MTTADVERSSRKARTAPEPEDPRKPDAPTDLTKPSWFYIFKRAVRSFGANQCTDLAAALTYYTVLAVFPGLLAVVSILGLFGQAEETTDQALDLLGQFMSQDLVDLLRGPIEGLTSSPAAGFAFVVGVGGALWSASGYVGGFGRALNRIYEIDEGRPIWKLRPTMLLVTLFIVVTIVIAALIVVLSGDVARVIGDAIGLGPVAVTVWNIAKWPVLAFLMVLMIAVLYYWSPNVRQPKFRWLSIGSLLALVIWVAASVGFGFYVSNFANYNATYGSLGAVIIFLLWIWISNLALLFGAQFDAELERGRQLQAGIAAEEHIQLPPRDTKASDKKAAAEAKDVLQGRRLRKGAAARAAREEERREREQEQGEREQKQRERAERTRREEADGEK